MHSRFYQEVDYTPVLHSSHELEQIISTTISKESHVNSNEKVEFKFTKLQIMKFTGSSSNGNEIKLTKLQNF
jgi:hypothetical protein